MVYDPIEHELKGFRLEVESAEYAACTFNLNELRVCFRVAKTTPLKVGQFVTLWKRIGTGPIQPFDSSDELDFYVVSTRGGARFGQFVFPRSVLCERDVLSHQGQGGKRAIRVYPPWSETTNKQARLTQRWQLEHFLEIPQDGPVDLSRFRLLYQSSRA